MHQSPSDPVLDYDSTGSKPRPGVKMILLSIFLPWPIHALLTAINYAPQLAGVPGNGFLIIVGWVFGLAFPCVIIVRSRLPLWLKITLLLLLVPAQLYCLLWITGNVAIVCGHGGDNM